jgi:hypothetical protein
MASELVQDGNCLRGMAEAVTGDCAPDRWQGSILIVLNAEC